MTAYISNLAQSQYKLTVIVICDTLPLQTTKGILIMENTDSVKFNISQLRFQSNVTDQPIEVSLRNDETLSVDTGGNVYIDGAVLSDVYAAAFDIEDNQI